MSTASGWKPPTYRHIEPFERPHGLLQDWSDHLRPTPDGSQRSTSQSLGPMVYVSHPTVESSMHDAVPAPIETERWLPTESPPGGVSLPRATFERLPTMFPARPRLFLRTSTV